MVTLTLEQHFGRQGGQVKGKVFVLAHGHSLHYPSIQVKLCDYHVGQNNKKTYQTHDVMILGNNVHLAPRQEITWDFSLQLPKNSRLSTNKRNFEGRKNGWIVQAVLERPLWSKVNKEDLEVQMAQEAHTILYHCESLGLRTIKEVKWNKKTNLTSVYFLPNADLEGFINQIRFEYRQTLDHGIQGNFYLKLVDKSLVGFLKNVIDANDFASPFNLSYQELYLEPELPNHDHIRQRLETLFVEMKQHLDPQIREESAGRLSIPINHEVGQLSLTPPEKGGLSFPIHDETQRHRTPPPLPPSHI